MDSKFKVDDNLSPELKSILNEAFKIAKKKCSQNIPFELVVYLIIKKYATSTSDTLESDILRSIFEEFSMEERINIEKDCLKVSDRIIEKNIFPTALEYYNPNSITLGDDLAVTLARAKESLRIVGGILGSSEKELSVNEFLTSALFVDSPIIDLLKDKYDLTKERIFEKTMKTLSSAVKDDKSEGELKEKRLSSQEYEDSADDRFEKAGSVKDEINTRKTDPNSKTPMLDQFAVDMTEYAESGKYDVIVGRDKELNQIIEILSCRKKNNAVLLGDPGCGKTAIVEGLAQRIVSGNIPYELKGKRIMSLSTTDLTAGTQYRGQLEQRIQNLCSELKENRDIILYIDEFHQATSEGSTSIADMLKPSLGRGELTMIASTTVNEYKKYIEKDGALKRRFQRVLVDEPGVDETYQILLGLSEKYEDYHKVRYTSDVLKVCAEWSDKYIYDRKSPDRAIDLMDTAGARTKLLNPKDTSEIEKLEIEIAKVNEEKARLIQEDKFEDAMVCRDKAKDLNMKLEGLKNSCTPEDKATWPEVTIECVADIISKLTNIPVDKICNPEVAKLKTMKTDLESRVIGQEEAIKETSMALSKSFLGLRDETKPIASIMLLGSSGTGKTLLCEEICKTVYGDVDAMIRIDCGEYAQSHTITKLLGAPASYVGYGEPGIFDQIRERPNSLILFDEVEKMSEEIRNTIFLNIMSTGFVKMSNGVDVSFRNCIIVFTGNVGTKSIALRGDGIGFGSKTKEDRKKSNYELVMKDVKKTFRPEFIGRLTKIVVFNDLGQEEMQKIYDLELKKLQDRLLTRHYTLTTSDKLKEYIISTVDTKYGARDLSRGITTMVEDKICETMLETDVTGKFNIVADLDESNNTVIKFS